MADVKVEGDGWGWGGGILKCTVVSWPNLDWQKTADFLTVSALCLLRAGTCREIKRELWSLVVWGKSMWKKSSFLNVTFGTLLPISTLSSENALHQFQTWRSVYLSGGATQPAKITCKKCCLRLCSYFVKSKKNNSDDVIRVFLDWSWRQFYIRKSKLQTGNVELGFCRARKV